MILYIDKIEYQPKCFNFVIQKSYDVVNPAPTIVTVTDYYHPERSNSVVGYFFSFLFITKVL